MTKIRTFDTESKKPSKETRARWAEEDATRSARRAAWQEGMLAWSNGVHRSGNPYPKDHVGHRSWARGWRWKLRTVVLQLKWRRHLGDYTAWPKQLKDVRP